MAKGQGRSSGIISIAMRPENALAVPPAKQIKHALRLKTGGHQYAKTRLPL